MASANSVGRGQEQFESLQKWLDGGPKVNEEIQQGLNAMDEFNKKRLALIKERKNG